MDMRIKELLKYTNYPTIAEMKVNLRSNTKSLDKFVSKPPVSVHNRTCDMEVGWTIATSLVALILFLYYVTTKNFNYWKKKKVPYAKPLPLFGNYVDWLLHRKFMSEISQDLCRQFPGAAYFGTFYGTEPALMIQDPELIKLVMIKDFYYFNSRELMDYTTKEVVTQNLFFNYGDKWKIVRQGLTPLFTSAKMKNMFHLIRNCAHSFEDMLDHEVGKSVIFDNKIFMMRYTIDCISSCSFGIDVKTMEKNSENNPFLAMGQFIFSTSLMRGYALISRAMWPKIFYSLGFQCFPRKIDQFFHKILIDVFKGRNYEPSQRNDFVDMVLGLKKHDVLVGDSLSNLKTGLAEKVELDVTDDLLVSQCVVFFAAGFETSAGALSMTLFELAKNQEAQRRAQDEVDAFLKKHNNEIVYDCVTELPFLEACVSETLRLYPVLPVLTREVVEDYMFPSGLRVERGMRIHIPVYSLHHDPGHFPEPENFKPERFLPGARHPVKPCTYMPFGEGPRTCIGMRFSRMQVLPGLVTFLKKFHVTLAESTPEKIVHRTTTIVLQSATPLHVKVSLRDGWEDRAYKR